DDKCVDVTKSKGGIFRQPSRRIVGRYEVRHALHVIPESHNSLGRLTGFRARQIVVTGREKERDSAFGGQSIDEWHKTDIPLSRISAVDDSVAGLQNEFDGIWRGLQPFDRAKHAVYNQRMFVLE